MMKTIDQLGEEELRGKKVLLRADFNVPVDGGRIAEVFRIKSQKETVDYLVEQGAKVALISHIEAIPSFGPIIKQIGEVLGQTLTLVPLGELGSLDPIFKACPVVLIDNIRQDKREIENDKGLALSLSKGFDFYINDAFAVMHRNHASVVAITKHLPSYAGFLVKRETENLSKAIKAPARGKIMVLGGAKISTKLPVIKNFFEKAEKILIGGALANNFFKARGINVGASVVDAEVPSGIKSEKIILPEDIVVSSDKTGESGAETYPVKDIEPEQLILDIGPETTKRFAEIIAGSELVIWNGPMGLSEVEKFAEGTRIIAQAVASASRSIVGGGDTIAVIDKLGLLDKMTFVSTGGGAMLDFLAGNELAGLKALGYYD